VPLKATFDRFDIERLVGSGGMATVYRAIDRQTDQPVALKVLHGRSVEQTERFEQEAELLAELSHPAIVRYVGHGTTPAGEHYLAMEWLDGETLEDALGHGPLTIGQSVELGRRVAEALASAHRRGIVHRDIKPGNLLVTQENGRETVKLADFGLARVYQVSEMSGLTLTGDIGGTLAFMAPEQVTHYRDARPPADQYAAAATLYNLLTGCLIHDFPNDFRDQLVLIMQEKPVPIRSRRPEIPEKLAEAIHRALAREPGDRFADVRALRLAVSKFCR